MTNKYHEKELETTNFDNLELFTFNNLITKCKVVNVYDGDTVTIVFYYGNSPLKVKFRLYGFDTPEVKLYKSKENGELHKKAGLYVKDKLQDKILNKIFWVKFHEEEKYGRTMGELFEIADKDNFTGKEQSINNWIIDKKYGKVYGGGKKEEFTKEELEYILNN